MSDRWILGFTDLNWDRLDTSILEPFTTLLGMTKSIGCRLSDLEESCSLERDFKVNYTCFHYNNFCTRNIYGIYFRSNFR